jgi:hypothetical protein
MGNFRYETVLTSKIDMPLLPSKYQYMNPSALIGIERAEAK